MNRQNIQLTVAQQAGQRLMIGFDGLAFNDQLKYYIGEIKVGGVILFARNISSPEQVRDLCSAAQAFAAQCGQPPLLIGIDQEGGAVARLKPPFTQFAGNPLMKDPAEAERFAQVTATELRGIGVNINMAPVLDVADPQGASVMRTRVFGGDPRWVAIMGNTVIRHLQSNGIKAVAKHFPGIGRTLLDSHEDLPVLDIDRDTLSMSDLYPFSAAIEAGVSAVMLSHIRYLGLDPQWPASLSVVIARDLLRREMGFGGLVLTDDIDMGALVKHYELKHIVDRCLASEIDLILICHPGSKIESAFSNIQARLAASSTLREAGLQSVKRILQAKEDL